MYMSSNSAVEPSQTASSAAPGQPSLDDGPTRQSEPASIPTAVTLRVPSSHTLSSSSSSAVVPPAYPPPLPSWLRGTWHVTHSTLPMWRGKCNVRITYTPLPGSHASGASTSGGQPEMPDLDDLVEYQKAGSGSGGAVSTVRGVSRAVRLPLDGQQQTTTGDKGWAFSWRGRGWLAIASSRWEVLGYGEDLGKPPTAPDTAGRGWAVTYFSKTLFTPAGIDVYCRDPAGLSDGCLEDIKQGLGALGVKSVEQLADQLFEVPRE